MKVISVGLFGMLGVLTRYLIGLGVAKALPSPFPLGTFGINIVGAFLIGVAYVVGFERSVIPPELRIGIMVGFLGGFTTFSSYSLEFARLVEEAEYWYAALYFCLSNAVGVVATFLGLILTRVLVGSPS